MLLQRRPRVPSSLDAVAGAERPQPHHFGRHAAAAAQRRARRPPAAAPAQGNLRNVGALHSEGLPIRGGSAVPPPLWQQRHYDCRCRPHRQRRPVPKKRERHLQETRPQLSLPCLPLLLISPKQICRAAPSGKAVCRLWQHLRPRLPGPSVRTAPCEVRTAGSNLHC